MKNGNYIWPNKNFTKIPLVNLDLSLKFLPKGIQIIAFTSNSLKTTATTFQFLQVYLCFPISQEDNNT